MPFQYVCGLKRCDVVVQGSVRSNDGVDVMRSRNVAVRSLDILGGDHESIGSDNEQMMNAIRRPSILPSNVMQAVIGVKFIADHLKQQDDDDRVTSPSAHLNCDSQNT